MIVLSETIDPNGKLTPELLARGMARLKDQNGMPINSDPRPRLSTSIEVCRAYIAVLLNEPSKTEAVLRELRIAIMAGELADDPTTVSKVIQKCDIDEGALKTWLAQPAVEAKLRSDMRAARKPSPIALALSHKLGTLPDGAKRYSAGSYVVSVDGEVKFELPGFWPLATYELVTANLAPELSRQPDAPDVKTVLEWTAAPLATVEVAAIMNKPVDDVRTELKKSAHFTPVAEDGFWSLA